MKRLFCLLLVILFLPVLSFADDDPFVGIWINDIPSSMKSRTIVTYQILSSGTVFYSRQEHFFNGDAAKVETAVYSSESTGESIRIQDGDRIVTELYRVNAYQLSTDSRKTYGFYNRVLESNAEYLAARSFEEQAIQEAEAFVTPPPVSTSDIPDISGLSYQDLVLLREKINLFIWNSQEWQEVTVPAGTYQIGVDIPAGHWTLRVAADHDSFNVFYFDVLDEFGKSVGYGSKLLSNQIATADFSPFGAIPITEIDIDMHDGWYLYLGGATVFTPYIGKPDLGFK